MTAPRVLALSGGVGGAKLADGLYKALAANELQVLVNTGDDFQHLGLHISPDIDTLLYTLSARANPATGWGRQDESWRCMDALRELGQADWFQLGDRDLATHITRTHLLGQGHSLTQVTASLARQLGIQARITPMTDAPAPTRVQTADGWQDFQHYFVRQQCKPCVSAIHCGANNSTPLPSELLPLLRSTQLDAVVLCPSNPYLSIDPILAVPGLRDALRASPAPVIAVSPLVDGKAVKGPTDKLMTELGISVSSRSIADHYGDLLDGLIIDHSEQALAEQLPLPVLVTATLMRNSSDRQRLAIQALTFAAELRSRKT